MIMMWKLPPVDIKNFNDHESTFNIFQVLWFPYIVKLNWYMVQLDRHHSTYGIIYQASVCVNSATQHLSCFFLCFFFFFSSITTPQVERKL